MADAIKDFNRAIKLKPNNTYAYSQRGLAKVDAGNITAGIEDNNRAIEINPEDLIAYDFRGRAKTQLGDYESAI